MTDSPSFACPWCGGIISHQQQGATFACPYCKAKVTAPYTGEAPVVEGGEGGAGARIQLGPNVQINGNIQPTAGGGFVITRKRVEGELFSNDAGELAIGYDPAIGYALIGSHAPNGQPPRLRAVDLVNKRVAWEALLGQTWIEELSGDAIGVHGRNVYIANNRSLVVLDLFTGVQRWATQLSDKVETTWDRNEFRGPAVIDPFPAEGRGAVLVLTIDHQLSAFDRDTGHPLWQRSFEGSRERLRAIHGRSVIAGYVSDTNTLEILNPGYAAPVATLGAREGFDVRGMTVEAGMIVAKVDKKIGDDEEEQGVAVIDPSSGRVVGYEKTPDLGGGASFDESIAVIGWGRSFAMVDDGAHIQTGGRRVAAPLQDYKAVALEIGGPTLFVMLEKTKGTSVRRLVGLDPETLAMRFDLGELGTEPDDDHADQLQTDGYCLVYVASKDDEDDCELRACDTTSGKLLWRRAVGEWFGHAFLGGYLVYFSRREMGILRPDNGVVLASYP